MSQPANMFSYIMSARRQRSKPADRLEATFTEEMLVVRRGEGSNAKVQNTFGCCNLLKPLTPAQSAFNKQITEIQALPLIKPFDFRKVNHCLKVCWECFLPGLLHSFAKMLGEQLNTLAGCISQAFTATSATCSVTILASLKPPASFCLICRVSSLVLNLAGL